MLVQSYQSVSEGRTIEFMDVMHNGLHHSSATRFSGVQTHSLGLPLVEFKDNSQWRKHDRLNDCKRTIGPTPAARLQERLSRQWTNKRSTDERSAGEGERKGTVPQTGSISHEDLQNKIDGIVSNPVEHVASGIGVGVVAGGHNDQAHSIYSNEEKVTLSTAPDVDRLCNGQFEHTTDDTVQDVGGTDLGGGGEVTVGVVDNIAVDG